MTRSYLPSLATVFLAGFCVARLVDAREEGDLLGVLRNLLLLIAILIGTWILEKEGT